MDRLESMSVLLSVVESGSLSAASRKLGIPLASISRKVSELETHLKTRLLNRTTRSLELTESGRTYTAACTRILEEISEAERIATGEYSAPKGKLLVTAPVVFGRIHILPLSVTVIIPDLRYERALYFRQGYLTRGHQTYRYHQNHSLSRLTAWVLMDRIHLLMVQSQIRPLLLMMAAAVAEVRAVMMMTTMMMTTTTLRHS